MGAEKTYYINLPPSASAEDAEHQVVSAVTGAAAANFDWVASLGTSAPKGKCFVTVEALTTPVYVRFKDRITAAVAGTTSTNGRLIPAGSTMSFYVQPKKHGIIDHLSTGAGNIKVYVSSPIGDRTDV
jgi:hypothetical protein